MTIARGETGSPWQMSRTRKRTNSKPKFAVQFKIKKRKLPCAVTKLQQYADGRDVFEFQWSFLPVDLSLISWGSGGDD